MKYLRRSYPQSLRATACILVVLFALLYAVTTTTTTALMISTREAFHQRRPYTFTLQLPSLLNPATILCASISSDETASFTDRDNHQSSSSSQSPSPTMTMPSTNKKKPTLYDILGATPTATRSELKQKYVALAKITHPDAKQQSANATGGTGNESTTFTTPYDFNDIATAYKILSDSKQRRRYDRSIQAEILTEQIASAVQNHPITELTIKALETIAVPFFRTMNKVTTTTTTTTTSTTTDATSSIPVQDEYRSESTNDGDSTFERRSQQELEREAQNEYNRLLQIRQSLQEVTQQRLRVAMYTSQSGLNSNEAYSLLNSFPTTGGSGPSWVERLNFLRSSVEAEINTLQNTEQDFIQQQHINTRAQNIHQSTIHDQFVIRQNLMNAERKEEEARRALERAMDETRQQRYQYERISEELFAAENAAVHASNELDRIQNAIQKQSENVRLALIRKVRALINNQNHCKTPERSEQDEGRDSSKPEPPMSPLFTASSYTSSKSRSSPAAEWSSELPLMESSESSMLDAWPKQSMSTTTFTQPPMSAMGFETDDGISSEYLMENYNDMNELMRLRQEEYELTMTINEIESYIHRLTDQMHRRQT